jgi:hypothetical protein
VSERLIKFILMLVAAPLFDLATCHARCNSSISPDRRADCTGSDQTQGRALRMNRLDFGCAFEKHQGWLGFDLNDHGHNLVGDVLDARRQ